MSIKEDKEYKRQLEIEIYATAMFKREWTRGDNERLIRRL